MICPVTVHTNYTRVTFQNAFILLGMVAIKVVQRIEQSEI